jgi:hypothetical protein
MEDQTIGEIPLQGSSKLIFTVSEWRGRPFASVRKFVATQKYEGPTKSGMALNKGLLREIIGVLATLEQSLPAKTEAEIKRIPKNETDYIKIATLPADDGETLPAVDMREFVESASYQGPTKRGIRFRWNVLPDVLACFREQMKAIGEGERNEPSLFGTGAFAEPVEEVHKHSPVGQAEGLADFIGEPVKMFPAEFLDNTPGEGNHLTLPEIPLRLDQDKGGNFHLKSEEGSFCPVRNPAEGNFIIYSQLRGHKQIVVPKAMINVFKAVKAYENYVRSFQAKLIAKVLKKVGQRSVAEYEAKKKMGDAGLPWLSSG